MKLLRRGSRQGTLVMREFGGVWALYRPDPPKPSRDRILADVEQLSYTAMWAGYRRLGLSLWFIVKACRAARGTEAMHALSALIDQERIDW